MTEMIKADEAVLKTDGLGRVQTLAARREQLLDEFERSGLSGKKLAALVGIEYPTLATWASKRRRERGEPPAARHSKGLREGKVTDYANSRGFSVKLIDPAKRQKASVT
jgi:hypothetical protein